MSNTKVTGIEIALRFYDQGDNPTAVLALFDKAFRDVGNGYNVDFSLDQLNKDVLNMVTSETNEARNANAL